MTYSHQELKKDLATLLESKDLTAQERALLQQAEQDLTDDKYLMRVVQDLKNQLSPLATKGQLSPSVLAFFTELSRRVPATGPSSIWNFLIKKKSWKSS